jgi:hypothetical protein
MRYVFMWVFPDFLNRLYIVHIVKLNTCEVEVEKKNNSRFFLNGFDRVEHSVCRIRRREE